MPRRCFRRRRSATTLATASDANDFLEAQTVTVNADGDAVAAQASRLSEEGFDVRGEVADVTDHATLDRVIDEAAETFSPQT